MQSFEDTKSIRHCSTRVFQAPPPQIFGSLSKPFTGSIPSQWATMRLVEISFMGNSLSGPFPKVLTNITTLRNLSIEGNRFSGPITPEIGKLIHLRKLRAASCTCQVDQID
ncbi:hypothetical protein ACB092_11G203200 [Castanea dentata]